MTWFGGTAPAPTGATPDTLAWEEQHLLRAQSAKTSGQRAFATIHCRGAREPGTSVFVGQTGRGWMMIVQCRGGDHAERGRALVGRFNQYPVGAPEPEASRESSC